MTKAAGYRSYKRFRQGDELPTPSDGYRLGVLRIPDVHWVRNLINVQLSELVFSSRFSDDPFLGVSKEDAAQIFSEMFLEFSGASILIGTLAMYVTATPPTGVLPMDGGSYARADYPDLYAVLHPSYIVDANTFILPDMNGVFARGGTPNPTQYGEETVTLTVAEMPSHTHGNTPHFHGMVGAIGTVINGGVTAPAPSALPSPSATNAASVNILPEGGGLPHNNLPPYVTVQYGIWYI